MIKLYKKTKLGKIQEWFGFTQGPEIVILYGYVDGIKQESRRVCQPKNVGKKNATTAEQQAELELASLVKKQKDKGYFPSIEDALNTIVIRPMLAHKYEDKGHLVSFPCTAQPKLDGVRCLAAFCGGEIKLFSRANKEFKTLGHIKAEIAKINKGILEGSILDGELYIHGSNLQDINSKIKRYQENETEKIEYRIYDTFIKDKQEPWEDRNARLHNINRSLYVNKSKSVKTVGSLLCGNESDVELHHANFVAQGYEGLMLRNSKGVYEINQRSSNLLKVKSFKDEEFPITGYKSGVGKFKDCVIWECQTPEGKFFDVVPKGTLEEKKEWLEGADSLIGKMLKVQFFDKTQDQIPRFPVGICIREDFDQ